MGLSKFSGLFNATSFAYGVNPQVPPLMVVSGPGVTGAGALQLAYGTFATADGFSVSPLNTNAPVIVGGNSSMETQTPTSVSTATPLIYGTSSVSATWTYAHGNGDTVRSGTVGLQEALNFVAAYGGGVVMLDAAWYLLGGTAAIIAAATVPAKVSIWDASAGAGVLQSITIPLTLAQIQGAFTTPVAVLPAPGAGSMISVIDATLNLIYGSAAYAGGGAAQLSYGAGVTYPATATWPASYFTGLAANSVQKVAGAAALTGSVNYLNKAINYTNATAVFTAGTGGSGVLIVNYRVQSGLS